MPYLASDCCFSQVVLNWRWFDLKHVKPLILKHLGPADPESCWVFWQLEYLQTVKSVNIPCQISGSGHPSCCRECSDSPRRNGSAGVFGRLLFHCWVTMPQAASRIDCSIAWNNRIGPDMSGLKPFDFDSFQQIQQMCSGLGREIWSSGNQRFLIPAHSTLWVLLRARATLSPSFKPLGTALSRWRSQKMRNPQSPPNEIGHNHIRVCPSP